jgi:3-oxoadipate enol-lactonase
LKKLGYSTVALDLRGHGLSSRSDHGEFYEFDNFCKDVVGLIELEKIKKPILVGHCFGGMIALLTEYQIAPLAKAMILIGTGSKPPSFTEHLVNHRLAFMMLQLFAKYAPTVRLPGHVDFSKFMNSSDFNARRILSNILHVSIKTYFLISEKMMKYNSDEFLSLINIPTQIIGGEDDSIFPPVTAEYLKSKITNSGLSFIPGANHTLVTNNPKELVSVMTRFVNETLKR